MNVRTKNLRGGAEHHQIYSSTNVRKSLDTAGSQNAITIFTLKVQCAGFPVIRGGAKAYWPLPVLSGVASRSLGKGRPGHHSASRPGSFVPYSTGLSNRI